MKITRKENEYIEVKNVEIREPLVGDFIKAEMIAGKSEGLQFALALLSVIVTFDGKRLDIDDIKKLRGRDFLELVKESSNFGMEELAKQLINSQDTQKQD
jgi:hypothetical protein